MFDKRIRETIVKEYQVGALSYRQLGKKYGVNYKTIYRWVGSCEKGFNADVLAVKLTNLQAMEEDKTKEAPSSSLAAQLQELQKQLEREKLHNRLLTAMIDIAEEELKIPIRKKYGTRQSGK